ncbi:transcription initiation factor TFIID subunit 8-like [Varroa jacobsoni]|uniref:Transcription initiation factor TFIID subunit 8 n=1 Tax=Varroa destructor TaxID=109461 RepID=A0A7M7K8Z4_VARDE|nr:transcription initiation factor TFIID subunit 8-like [Varroa destructor]XP_022685801.1 transcription initiation factor TFIID subunit 8-like [Varroa jacobsoni]
MAGPSHATPYPVYRRVLQSAVSAICLEQGFGFCDATAMETLTEMLQATLIEVCHSAKSFAELGGRTEASAPDVCLAIADIGIRFEGMRDYMRRPGKIQIASPGIQACVTTPLTLRAGERKPLPSHIPDHFPPFPDSHAYIRTLTHRQPVTEYVAIREKVASQKRDIERALTRFVAKTSGTQTLFPDNPTLYPLIACKPSPQPWLVALEPKDQVFEDEEDDEKEELVPERGESGQQPDNPYLRGVKMPRRRF